MPNSSAHPSRATTAVLRARHLHVELGGRLVLADVSLTVGPTSRLGVVGVNGVGKSTLLRVLAGLVTPQRGTITLDPPHATVGYLSQEHDCRPGEQVRKLIARVTGVEAAERELLAASEDLAVGSGRSAQRYDTALHRFASLGVDSFEARLARALAEAALSGLIDAEVASLSGGQEASVALVALVLSRFDVVLLDEPTNDLDFAGLDRLETWVGSREGATVIVSHDREFLERSVNAVVELDEHRRCATQYGGGWKGFERERAAARQLADEAFEEFRDERARLKDRAQRQRQWALTGVAKERRNPRDHDTTQRDFRLNRTEKLARKARQSERALERLGVVDKPFEGWDLRFSIDETRRSGDTVVELLDAVVDCGAFRLGPLHLQLSWRDRVAVTGANGAGKTTLLNVILGRVALDGGARRIGPSVVMGVLNQDRRLLRGDHDLVRYVGERCALTQSDSRTLLAKFGVGAAHLERSSRELSPGERTRVELAVFQSLGVNLLVLDEPTNHLDLAAIEQLERALGQFEGTLLLTTHDRRFLDHVEVTRTIEVDRGTLVERA